MSLLRMQNIFGLPAAHVQMQKQMRTVKGSRSRDFATGGRSLRAILKLLYSKLAMQIYTYIYLCTHKSVILGSYQHTHMCVHVVNTCIVCMQATFIPVRESSLMYERRNACA